MLAIVKQTVRKVLNVEDFIGEGCWFRFMKCHPRLSLTTPDPISRSRRNAVTEENMKSAEEDTGRA